MKVSLPNGCDFCYNNNLRKVWTKFVVNSLKENVMKAIIAHPNLDFDALASMVAAQKLYPGAVLVTVGKPADPVREFMVMHGDFIEVRNYIDKKDVDTLIMVDTRSQKRLLDFTKVLENEDLSVIVYDHHENSDEDIPGATVHYAPLGANVTQLVEEIRAQHMEITPELATLFALGIYDDTGSLRYLSTTARDVEAVAWLLQQGASLAAIAEYTTLALSPEQNELLAQLLQNSEIKTIHQRDVLISTARRDEYINGLSSLTVRIRDVYSVDAVFLVVRMENRIHIVGRSATKEIDVRAALKPYGGRGHLMAASAMLKDSAYTEDALVAALFQSLEQTISPPLTVGEVMTSPVKTVAANVSVNEIGEYMLRYGHSGYPVMEAGQLIGIISRRDVEKCKYHGLGNVPVKGYMSHRVITVGKDTTVEDARELMIRENVGRLPVLAGDELIGIVTRSDLLELVYGPKPGGRRRNNVKNSRGEGELNLLTALEQSLPKQMFELLKQISALADSEGIKAFLVGGLVRDLLLGESSIDLDIVVEGDGIAFAGTVAAAFAGALSAYPKFGTATVVVDGVVKIDIAGARTEYYEYPAAKPRVEQGSLKQDLFRRDFTVNAMALSLNYESLGHLIDYYNGREDLYQRKIRVLHNLSFVEDPTRILRALRFCARYHFTMTAETRDFALKAMEAGVLKHLSLRRLWHELELSLRESCAYEILDRIKDFGIWPLLFPDTPFDLGLKTDFERIALGFSWLEELKPKPDLPLVRFLILVYPMEKERLQTFFDEAQLPHVYRNAAWALRDCAAAIGDNGDDLSAVDWYHLIEDNSAEVLAAAWLKLTPPAQRQLTEACALHREYRVFVTAGEIREFPGYRRGQLDAILGDLLAEKRKGALPTKEAQLAYVRENLENRKYEGDLNV